MALDGGTQGQMAPVAVTDAVTSKCETAAKELHTTLSRALEFGMQQASHQLGLFHATSWCLDASSTTTCSCQVGHYANTQVIANLLHLVVQLALFQSPPTVKEYADATVQWGTPFARSDDRAIQVSPEVASCKVQASPLAAEASEQCGPAFGDFEERSVQANPPQRSCSSSVAQTDGQWLECATKGVRIGGGYHLFRSITSAGDRSASPVRTADFGDGSASQSLDSQQNVNSRGRTQSGRNQQVRDTSATQGWSVIDGLAELEFCAAETARAPHSETDILPDTEVLNSTFDPTFLGKEEDLTIAIGAAAESQGLQPDANTMAALAKAVAAMQERGMPLNAAVGRALREWSYAARQDEPDPQTVEDWVDEVLASGSRPSLMLPADKRVEATGVYGHYVHGVPAHGSPPNHYRVGAYSQSQRETLSRREIAEAVSAGRWDNVQLYRVLRADLHQHSMTADFPTSPLRQGKWRKRPTSAPARRRHMRNSY